MADNIKVNLELDDSQFKRSLNSATTSVSNFGKAATGATSTATAGFDRMGVSIKALVAASGIVLLIDSLIKLASFSISTTSEVEKLRVQLETVTGSAEVTAEAFAFLQEFATKTPYSINELTEAFTKLASYGIAPSERALTSFGNIASGMGKTLNQFIEAVADGAMGEFERLKEFGVKARNQGATIEFTFKGVTQSVKNNSAEITEYLTRLGETEFAGGMEKQSRTLSGMLSTLGDTFAQSMQKIANESGAFDGVKQAIQAVTEAIPPVMAVLGTGVQLISGFVKAIVNYVQIAMNGINLVAFSAGEQIARVGNMLGMVSDQAVADIKGKMNAELELLKGNLKDVGDAGKMMSGAFNTVSGSATVGREKLDAYNKTVADKAAADAERRRIERTNELAASINGVSKSLELSLRQAREKMGGDISMFGSTDREKAKVANLIALQHQYEQQVLQIDQKIATSKDSIEKGLLEKQKARIKELFDEQKKATSGLLDIQFSNTELQATSEAFKQLVSSLDSTASSIVTLVGKIDPATGKMITLKGSIDPVTASIARLTEAQNTLFNSLAAGLITGSQFEQLMKQVYETLDPVTQQMKSFAEATTQWLITVDPTIAAGTRLAENMKFLDGALASGKINQEDYNRLLKQFNLEAQLSIPTFDQFGNKLYTMTTAAKDFKEAVNQMGQGLSKTLREGGSVADFFKDKMLNAFDKIVDSFIQNGLNSLFSNMMGGGGGGGFGGMLSSLFAGFFANGGPIPAGKFGVVGEKGPEVVTGPAQVYSNKDSFGGSGMSVGTVQNNFSVNMSDFKSMWREAAAENVDYLIAMQTQLSQYRR